MKLSPTATLALYCALALLPSGLAADFSDPIGLGYSFARGVARDVRASWRNFHRLGAQRQQQRRHALTRRDQSGPGKCQLRLAGTLNSTSPADGDGGHSSSSSSPRATTSSDLHSQSTQSDSSSSSSNMFSSSVRPTSTTTSSSAIQTPTYPPSIFSLKQLHNGSSFFDGWDFWNLPDPTSGDVNYLDSGDAWNSGLVSINGAGHAVLKVDTTPVVSGNRDSIRISFQDSFNGGLLTADIYHMPTGCATWPAWWTNGPDWPTYGEIDIVEGVHNQAQNQISLHTAPGCTMSSSSGFAGNIVNGQNCGSTSDSNTGCGILADDTASFGQPFNNGGGGVYAMLWDNTGIRVWLFHRGSIPADLTRDMPLPETWGEPMAFISSSGCNPYQYMQNHIAILDTTLCGTWAGSGGSWGGSCAASTGYASCTDYVQAQGGAFANAYWEIASVKLYQ